MKQSNLYVIIGGPCVGKTTTADELAKLGYCILPEGARATISEELKKNSNALPWKDVDAFQSKVMARLVKTLVDAPKDIPVICDTSLPCGLAYYKLAKIAPPSNFLEVIEKYHFKGVFLLEDLPIQYAQDDERRHTSEEAKKIREYLVETYVDLGYAPIPIPPVTSKERAKLIVQYINWLEGKK